VLSLLVNLLADFVRRLLTEQIHIDIAKQTDPVAITFDPIIKKGDNIFIRMLGIDAQRDDILHFFIREYLHWLRLITGPR